MLLAFCVLFCRKAFIPVLGGGAAALALGGQAVLQRLESIRGGYGGDTSIALRMAYLKSTKWIIEEFPLGVAGTAIALFILHIISIWRTRTLSCTTATISS